MLFTGLAATGCGGSDEPPDEAPAPASDAAAVSDGCPDWANDLTYGPTDGLVARDESGELAARVVWASDVPARSAENSWRIRLEDADGAPVDDPIVRWACAFNPDHGHGVAPTLGAGAMPGELELGELRFWVEGGWQVQLWIDPADSGKPDYQQVTPCGPVEEPLRPPDLTLDVCVPLQ
jgi:hypothetical protein